MNNVILIGRLTRDPVIRQANTASGSFKTANFTLAVDRPKRRDGGDNTQTADFPRVACIGKPAELVEEYMKQGTKICVRGHLQTGSYKTKDGRTVFTTDVIADQLEFVESKNAGSGTQTEISHEDIPETDEPPFR